MMSFTITITKPVSYQAVQSKGALVRVMLNVDTDQNALSKDAKMRCGS